MKKILLCAAAILILTGITTAADKEIGEIVSINSTSKEVIVNSKSGTDLKMGELLEIRTESGKIILEATFPMMTTSKCRIRGKGKLSELSPGMTVYRFSKDAVIKNEPEGKSGEIKTIGNIEMVKIPGGTFQMGSDESYDERPLHKVTLDGFLIGKYEVTQKQYEEIMGVNPSNFAVTGPDLASMPVEQVRWEDAVEFCNKLSEKNGLKPYYKYVIEKGFFSDNITVTILGGNGFRLPTEAEWEYACRGGSSTKYYWGDKMDGGFCWYSDNSGGQTNPVGRKKPNAFGLYDMSGNVWEWCTDWYDENYYQNSTSKNPDGALKGSDRSLRGGSWNNSGFGHRSACRGWLYPGANAGDGGFRVVISR